MAPIQSSQRALSIGAIGFARGHVFLSKTGSIMISQIQIKSWEKGRQIKSNHDILKRRQIKSNHAIKKTRQIKSKGPKIHPNQIKSNHDLIFAHACAQSTWAGR